MPVWVHPLALADTQQRLLHAFNTGANLAWQHVQHQESLPDARAQSHDLRSLRHVLIQICVRS